MGAMALGRQPSLMAGAQQPAASSRTTSTILGNVENHLGQTLEMDGRDATFTGSVVNRGTLKITDSHITFAGTYTENGAYVSDPSTTHYTNLLVGSGGYLQGGLGDLFIVSGSFSNLSTQNTNWSTASSELDFGNGSAHPFLLAGADSGQSISGYTNNFAFGTMDLYSGQSLSLGAGSGSALYVGALVLGSGTSQVSSITGNGHNIYYDVLNPMNNYLGSGTYALSGGGSILPVSSLSPAVSGTVGQSITFNATVVGSVTFTYQWSKNGVAIGSATNASYNIPSAASTDSGTYTVLVSDTAGQSTTGTSVLTIGSAVPAMGPWALASLALLLLTSGVPFLRARRAKL